MAHDAREDTVRVEFTLNGKVVSVEAQPADRLLDTIRYGLALPGTKEGCGEGECGSCTVLLDGLPANSCLVPTYQVRGRTVETVESLSEEDVAPLLRTGATQCGACTPGVVMTATWIRRHPEVLEAQGIRALMAGNLCRCTGYDGIVEGVEALVVRETGG